MINKTHPIHRILEFVAELSNADLEFSRYIYLGYGKTQSRQILNVEAENLSKVWLENQLQALQERQELAMHSRIRISGCTYHIPMIDFINVRSPEDVILSVEPLVQKLGSPIVFYNSGKSLHGYFLTLVDQKEWETYLADLLLCNDPTSQDIVDTRWVGHCILQRFSALRWSYNSETYKSMPQYIERSHGAFA